MKTLKAFLKESKWSDVSYTLSTLSTTSKSLCGPTSLQAFGICNLNGNKELKVVDFYEILESNGYRVDVIHRYAARGYTLGDFIREHPNGSYILMTSRHAMAYIDGELTDTAHTKRALSKKLEYVLKITK